MKLMEAILTRRSVRRYTRQPVPEVMVRTVLEAAIWAPSGGNLQPWEFIVITEPGAVAAIRSLSPGMFGEPPVVIVLCANRRRAAKRGGTRGEFIAVLDVAMAAQNLLLAAHSLGLGACVIRSFHEGGVGQLLACPAGITPELLVALGYPEGEARRPSRRPLEAVVHPERWTGEGSA